MPKMIVPDNTHRQIDDLTAECRRLEALLLEESHASAARFHVLNEIRAVVNLPKTDDDPIPGLVDAVRSAVRPSDAQTGAPQCASKLPSADQLTAIVNRYEAWRQLTAIVNRYDAWPRQGLAQFDILNSAAAQDRADLLNLARVLAKSLDRDFCQVCGDELPSDHACPDILAALRRVVAP